MVNTNVQSGKIDVKGYHAAILNFHEGNFSAQFQPSFISIETSGITGGITT